MDIDSDSAICAVLWNTPSSSKPHITVLCDLNHILGIRVCVTLDLVKDRVIAGLMVVALLCGSGTVTFASLSAGPAMMHGTRTRQGTIHHACCPSIRPTSEFFVASNEAVTPCSEHPCCAKRRPQGPASLPAVNEGKGPELEIVHINAPLMFTSIHGATVTDAHLEFSPPSSSRSTVLRI